MISSKYKPGDRVTYISYDGTKPWGIVLPRKKAEELDYQASISRFDSPARVWCKWYNQDGSLDDEHGYMEENRVSLVKKYIQPRNLPEWW